MADQITPEIVERSRRMYLLARQLDPEWMSNIDASVEWHAPQTPYGGGELHGHMELLAFLEQVGLRYQDAYADPDEFLASGETLVVLGTWRGEFRATGELLETPFAHVQRFRDGRLAYMRVYMDTAGNPERRSATAG